MRILLVDDHQIVRRSLRQLLAEAYPQAEFEEAALMDEARLWLQQSWDLVLLDVSLPGGSGLDLLAEMRAAGRTAPVLMLSVFPEEEFAVRALKLGASGYLTKQSAADEMLLAAKKVLGGGKYVTAALAERLAAKLAGAAGTALHEALSPREREVLCMVAQGMTAKAIAAALGLSEKTVGTYRTRVAEKLGISTNVELTRYALRHRLVE